MHLPHYAELYSGSLDLFSLLFFSLLIFTNGSVEYGGASL